MNRELWGSHRHEMLVLAVTLCLFVFSYETRADLLGTQRIGEAWTRVSGPARAPILHFISGAILLGIVPAFIGCALLGRNPSSLGLGLGRLREGSRWLAAGVPLAILAGKIASASPSMRAVYPLDPGLTPDGFLPHALRAFLYYGAWEVLFRGVLLFGLRDRLGAGPANVLQTALSVTAHFGRPLDETFSALPAGLVFGWIDLRVRSVWYVGVIHWVLGTSMDWFILTGSG